MTKETFFYVICIKTDSGLPLFVRSTGSVQQLPDTVISSLNGINTFCSSYGVRLVKTTADETCISWKTFNQSLTLILVTNATFEEWFHDRLFNLIHNSFILLLGSDNILKTASFDKLKKDLQICYHLVDSLTTMIDHHLAPCIMTESVNSLASPDLPAFQLQFEGYTTSMGALLACFFIKGLLSAATKKFLQLSATELVLIHVLVTSIVSSSPSSITETVVYLPDTSPKQGLRLIVMNLIRGGVVCLLCGEKPHLFDLISKTQTFWESRNESESHVNFSRCDLSLVENLSRMMNTCLPYLKDINKDILGFLLINKSLKQCLVCTDLNRTEGNIDLESVKVLKEFYQHVANKFFTNSSTITNTGQDISVACKVENNHSALASYTCLENYKCFAFQEDSREMYIMFNNIIPVYALRSVSQEFLHNLLALKWFHL